MMNYKKSKNEEEELTEKNIPIECLPEKFLWMHVKGGTTVSNVIDYAKKAIDSGEHKSIVWSGCGGGVTKTISCAEIMKRSYDMHQVTRITYRKVDEYWEPVIDGLDQIVANRKIPCIHILMSLDEINSNTLGYQHSKIKTKFWEEPTTQLKKPYNNRGHNQAGGSGSKFGQGNNQSRKSKQKASAKGSQTTTVTH